MAPPPGEQPAAAPQTSAPQTSAPPPSVPEVPVAPMSPPAPAARDHKWGFGAFLFVFAVFVLSAVVIGAVMGLAGPDSTDSVAVILIGTIVPTALATAATLLVTVVRGNGPKIDLKLSYNRDDLRVGLKFGLIGLVCTTVAAGIWTRIVGESNATSALGQLVDNQAMPTAAAVTIFVYVWLVGPLFEEIMYRGLLWGALERLKWGRWAVFGLTTVIFAVSHLEPLRTSLLLVIGIPIGLARLYTGRLGASVVAHQVNNFLPALAVLLISLGVMQP
ncbi:CPBP family intramembrane glutamic endopeptidase [Actinokineospora sp. NBRC 105648]|uniref:CPBP family intramembrane glutamic endopeptidase n=1 Tax=Actinokineospora sp. NBRC 105648 TaxID=3032206 RepID=UPI0024A1B0FD|nr:CPBP family intramembrane glutamic endopeptidase [Actinokineospora sp. NBRC 105648]GLZ41493.1 membrane protein [Actinokineospora sp. NBRC 105648]